MTDVNLNDIQMGDIRKQDSSPSKERNAAKKRVLSGDLGR